MVKPITFGKHIPIMQGRVKDVKRNKYVPVTLSEIDCKDYEDIETMFQSCSKWNYTRHIAADMNNKYCCNYNIYDVEYPYNFYVLKDRDKNIIGFCETEDSDNNVNIEYLETNQDGKYKYAGQVILAMIGKIVKQQDKSSIFVPNAAPRAIRFYSNKCGFRPVDKDKEWGALIMDSEDISAYIEKIQKKTNAKIMDIRV